MIMKTFRFHHLLALAIIFFSLSGNSLGQSWPDTYDTSKGALEVNYVGHASLYFSFNGDIIHVDPYGEMADYTQMPKADLILITHAHRDHLDPEAIQTISKDNTQLIVNQSSYNTLEKGTVMENGDKNQVLGYSIKAVPAYNMKHKRQNGEPYHPKGRDNGYVITFGDKNVYIGGDTENIPEMKKLGNIDITYLPMNLPYTMSPEMTKEAALMGHPKVLYPYHYKMGKTDTEKFKQIMADVPDIEVRFPE